MTRKKRRRLAFAIALLVASAGGAALVVAALKDNVLYFYGPSDVAAKGVRPGIAFHIGGLVARWFIEREGGNRVVQHLVMLGTPNAGSPWPTAEASIAPPAWRKRPARGFSSPIRCAPGGSTMLRNRPHNDPSFSFTPTAACPG